MHVNLPDNTLEPNQQPRSLAPLTVGRSYVRPGLATGYFSCLRSREETLGILSVMAPDPRRALDQMLATGQLVEVSGRTRVKATGVQVVGVGWRSLRACAREESVIEDFDPGDLEELFRHRAIYVPKSPHTT